MPIDKTLLTQKYQKENQSKYFNEQKNRDSDYSKEESHGNGHQDGLPRSDIRKT